MESDVKLVVMRSFNHDYAVDFRASFARLGVAATIVEAPLFELSDMRPTHVAAVQAMLRPGHPSQRVLFCPGVMELFPHGDHYGLHFSAYRDWHDPARRTVLPHPWTVHAPFAPAQVAWSGKPPLSVGFMGSAYADALPVRAARLLPPAVRRRLLRGRYLRHPQALARGYAARVPLRFALAFPRAESLATLRRGAAAHPGMTLDLTDTGGFTGRQDAKDRYARAMLATTYVLCPRGSENFSFRQYEALQAGRVPVIVDTDMVLPDAVPWKDVAVVVPYDRLDRIADIIAEDYRRHDAAAFLHRQRRALEVAETLRDGQWLDRELSRVLAA